MRAIAREQVRSYFRYRGAAGDANGLPIASIFHEPRYSTGDWANHLYVNITGTNNEFAVGQTVTIQTGTQSFIATVWYIYQGSTSYNLYVHPLGIDASQIPDSKGGTIWKGNNLISSTPAPAPVVSVPAPVVSVPAPVVSVPAPVVSVPAPVVSAPVVTAPAPVVSAPAPVTSTAGPFNLSSIFHESKYTTGDWANHIYINMAGTNSLFKVGDYITVKTPSQAFKGVIWYLYQGTSSYNLYVHPLGIDASQVTDVNSGVIYKGIVDSVLTQAVSQPVVQPVVQPAPVVDDEPIVILKQPIPTVTYVDPVIQPVVQPVIQPVVQPVIQPVVQPAPVEEPVIIVKQPIPSVTYIDPVLQPAAEPAPVVTQPVTDKVTDVVDTPAAAIPSQQTVTTLVQSATDTASKIVNGVAKDLGIVAKDSGSPDTNDRTTMYIVGAVALIGIVAILFKRS